MALAHASLCSSATPPHPSKMDYHIFLKWVFVPSQCWRSLAPAIRGAVPKQGAPRKSSRTRSMTMRLDDDENKAACFADGLDGLGGRHQCRLRRNLETAGLEGPGAAGIGQKVHAENRHRCASHVLEPCGHHLKAARRRWSRQAAFALCPGTQSHLQREPAPCRMTSNAGMSSGPSATMSPLTAFRSASSKVRFFPFSALRGAARPRCCAWWPVLASPVRAIS